MPGRIYRHTGAQLFCIAGSNWERPHLIRLDSGHDTRENRKRMHLKKKKELLDFIIKWNPRNNASEGNKKELLKFADAPENNVTLETTREGNRIEIFSNTLKKSSPIKFTPRAGSCELWNVP